METTWTCMNVKIGPGFPSLTGSFHFIYNKIFWHCRANNQDLPDVLGFQFIQMEDDGGF